MCFWGHFYLTSKIVTILKHSLPGSVRRHQQPPCFLASCHVHGVFTAIPCLTQSLS